MKGNQFIHLIKESKKRRFLYELRNALLEQEKNK